ncbi:MAG: NAD(P)-dependent glycerol-3-phosphate dehydrogenase [Desulfobacterota bacterium]|nr:NAD(P)-dependent glycerol-3-phosphate dehydrogenase [Thermodesulfobacteriota bacterium]
MKTDTVSIGVVGAGSWGTTLAQLLAGKGYDVTLWVYERELLDVLVATRCNTWFLPGVQLHNSIRFTNNLEDAVGKKQLLLWVTPVKAFRTVFSQSLPFFDDAIIHISASKGIETTSLQTVAQIARSLLPNGSKSSLCVLSGPSFAREVARNMPTAVVIASADHHAAEHAQYIFATPYFRTYTSDDVIGVELGGALKNVVALAAGIVEGLGLGNNTRAALITRGLAEMIRLGTAMGAQPLTFAGLSGIGDLVLTCTSTLSRNYSVGKELGSGKPLGDILASMQMVAEGVTTAQSANALADRYGIEMPIVREVYQVLFNGKEPLRALQDLMNRELKREVML